MTKYIQDYYGILNVESDADNDTIKEAYECNMKKYHPDVNNGAKAKKRYELSQEAYDVLSDGDKRKEYDKLRERAIENQMKKEEEEKATQDFDYDSSRKSSSKSGRRSGGRGRGSSAFKTGDRSKGGLNSSFDLVNNIGKSGNISKIIGAGAKAGKSGSVFSLSKIILGGAATAYGVKKGRDYVNKGRKNQN